MKNFSSRICCNHALLIFPWCSGERLARRNVSAALLFKAARVVSPAVQPRETADQQPPASLRFFTTKRIQNMRSGHAHTITTNQAHPAHFFHTKHKYGAGNSSVTTTVKFPKSMHVDGFPSDYFSASVTPSQPVIVSISNETRYGFDVTLTAIDGGAIAEGVLSVMVMG
jgi:hypothetical protein